MTKVILTKEQATAIESAKSKMDTAYSGQAQFFYDLVQGEFAFSDVRQPLNKMSHLVIMRAILEGYELQEQTADEIAEEIEMKANNMKISPYLPDVDREAYNYGVARAFAELRAKGIKFTK